MATIYKCDQCHTEDKSPRFLRTLELAVVTYYGRNFAEPEKSLSRELCAPCMGKVIRATEPEPIVLPGPAPIFHEPIRDDEPIAEVPKVEADPDEIHF